MHSRLNKSEFRTRLKSNTQIGNPKTRGNPNPFDIFSLFTKEKKKFYGKFDNSSFQLTKNAILTKVPYMILGEYRSMGKNETSLHFKIKPIWFGYLFVKIVPTIFLITFNILWLTKWEIDTIEDSSILFILINTVLAYFLIAPNLLFYIHKRKMKSAFIRLFEITD